MVTSNKLKANQFTRDGGSIISKTLEVEKKSNAEFEHAHVRTTEGSENGKNDERLKMLLKCDKVAKEECVKCTVENRTHDKEVEGNMVLEKSGVEVIKGIDSDRNSLECIQHKYDENWELIDIEVRNVFACFTSSMIKCVAGINMYGERIKDVDKCNVTAVCPMYFETENWEHVIKCYENKDERDEWINMVGKIEKSRTVQICRSK